jgi:hypothetical protein
MQNKVCRKCLIEFPISEFPSKGKGPNGNRRLRSSCRYCYSQYKRDDYKKRQELKPPKIIIPLSPNKTCTRCELQKPRTLIFFRKNTYVKRDGLHSICRICVTELYRIENPPKVTIKAKEGYKFCSRCKLELEKAHFRIHKKDGIYSQCKKCENIYNRSRIKKTPKKVETKRTIKSTDLTRHEKMRFRNELKKFRSRFGNIIIKQPTLKQLANNIRRRTWAILKSKSWTKIHKFIQYLGCDAQELKMHLENKFSLGMNWNNYGNGEDKWNMDHIIPLASAKTVEELFALSHYTNIQPLWSLENCSKGDSLPAFYKRKNLL